MSLMNFPAAEKRKRLVVYAGAFVLALLITLGVFARNNWLPRTDTFGNRTGWFGVPLARGAGSSWNPFSAPLPAPTPQLSREYIYAGGSRLLATVDANAQETPPADLAIWRRTSGEWWVMGGQWSAQLGATWGGSNDEPVEGDYDGDGKTDFAVWRKTDSYVGASDAGNWYIAYSSDGTTAQNPFGQGGDAATRDKTAQADYDGDGKTDEAVFRPSTGRWYIRQSSNTSVTLDIPFGASTDEIAPADYDGDGRADIGVWRSSNQTFYSMNSSNGVVQSIYIGQSGDKVVSSDYDGDGKADYAVFNTSTAVWYIRQSSTGSLLSPAPQWGNGGDIPVQNDYDGDGKTDIATWRDSNGNWYIRQSAGGNSLRQVLWGTSGDIPVPALYRR
jgi:hypothetical protein